MGAPFFVAVSTTQSALFVTDILLAGLALMLIFEGLLPLLAPQAWRETFRRVIELSDGQLRFIGLVSLALGVVLFLLVK